MRPRNDILAVFSTFIKFAGDRFERWQAIPQLVRSMRQLQNDLPERSEAFWVLYWYRLLDNHPRASAHLWAYLQEPCYQVAEQVTRQFSLVSFSTADGFQIEIAHVPRILKRYNPDYGNKLKAYAKTAFGNAIRDYLRQHHELNISSDWGLLRRVSQSQLTEALQNAGFGHTSTAILIWQCFRHICTPTPQASVRGLPAPSEEQLQKIIQRFNQIRQSTQNNGICDAENGTTQEFTKNIDILNTQQVMGELVQIAAILRSYLNPPITSLNQPQYDDAGNEQLDILTHEEENTPMEKLLESEAYTEQQQQLQAMQHVLKQALANLPTDQQTLLTLYYRQKLTQSAIAQQLTIQQYQVSRQLERIRRQLLLTVITWGQTELHTPTKLNVLESVSNIIHQWLQCHYSPEPPED
ncbi:MAG: sigma-70 family RNA polymerase sigma factor [Cyanobacteria bacterium P01_D01_bin.156]